MPSKKSMKGREAIRALQRHGWEYVRHSGDHILLRKNGQRVTIPDQSTTLGWKLQRMVWKAIEETE